MKQEVNLKRFSKEFSVESEADRAIRLTKSKFPKTFQRLAE